VPSITELLVDLGWGAYLVGRTGFCIHPAEIVKNIPKVGGTKDVNLAKIKKLGASHVIVNKDENTLVVMQALQAFVPHVIVTHPQTPQDNLFLINQLLAEFSGEFAMNSEALYATQMRASALKDQIIEGLDQLKSINPPAERVLYLIWRDPWMTVAQDTYISRMLSLIGWQTWPQMEGGETGAARYPVIRGDEPWLQGVQRVLLSSEPYRFDASHLAEVKAWLPQAKVQLVDGEMLSWYGSRAVKGLAYLAELADSEASSSSE
jgi:ABC-type Fe3+-hydroxamate transport system substrate-binding protein